MTQEIVKRIDHVIVRVAQPEPLFTTLTGTLGLPPAWPVATNPIFTSGGVFMGNLKLEVLQTEWSAPPKGATGLYGLGFEIAPFSKSLPEMDRRNIPHTPPQPFIQPDAHRWLITNWTNVFIGGLIDTRRWVQAFTRSLFSAYQRAPSRLLGESSKPNSLQNRVGRPLLYDVIYRKGITYAVEYNPDWSAQTVQTTPAFYGLEMIGVREVIIGTRRLDDACRRWRRLLAPLPERDMLWTLPDGQHLRLVPAADDRLLAMVWQVRSLNRAAQYLHKYGLLGQQLPGQITIKPQAVGGLDIRIMA